MILLLSGISSATLGLAPGISRYDFVPGNVIEIPYSIVSDNPNQELEIFVGGSFEDFVTLSKNSAVGPENFLVTINLPNISPEPGWHHLTIGVKEIPSEDRFLGTSIDIRSVIKIFVPYPGKYAELSLSVLDGNVGEEIPVELKVINRGKEELVLNNVHIDFFTNNVNKSKIEFTPVSIDVSGERFFRKYLDTSGFEPGDYLAVASVNYGDLRQINQSFRVGSLSVKINNFTTILPKKNIQRFMIEVESQWNSDLENVYADINLSNGIGEDILFRSPSIDLKAWKIKNIESFLDTAELEGNYEVNIILNYLGEKTFTSGILVVEKTYSTMIIILIILIILIIIVTYIILKRKKGKIRRKKK